MRESEVAAGTTLGVSLMNHSLISRACAKHTNALCPPAMVVQAMKCDRSTSNSNGTIGFYGFAVP